MVHIVEQGLESENSAIQAASRRVRRRLEARERILDAAERLFGRKGYEAATVAEIAEAADLAKNTLFSHFPTKVALLRVLTERSLLEVFRDVGDLMKRDLPFAKKIVALFEETAEGTLRLTPRERELQATMVSVAMSRSAASIETRFHRVFRRFIEEGRDAGELREDLSLDTITIIVFGVWDRLFTAALVVDDYPLRERASEAARFLAESLCDP